MPDLLHWIPGSRTRLWVPTRHGLLHGVLCAALLACGCAPREVDPQVKAFVRAVQGEDFKAAAELIKTGVDPNTRFPDGETLLVVMAAGDLEACKFLLEHGADPNLGDSRNYTPLMQAAVNCKPEVVRELLKHGARIDLETKLGPLVPESREPAFPGEPYRSGLTALYFAKLCRDTAGEEVVALLTAASTKP